MRRGCRPSRKQSAYLLSMHLFCLVYLDFFPCSVQCTLFFARFRVFASFWQLCRTSCTLGLQFWFVFSIVYAVGWIACASSSWVCETNSVVLCNVIPFVFFFFSFAHFFFIINFFGLKILRAKWLVCYGTWTEMWCEPILPAPNHGRQCHRRQSPEQNSLEIVSKLFLIVSVGLRWAKDAWRIDIEIWLE